MMKQVIAATAISSVLLFGCSRAGGGKQAVSSSAHEKAEQGSDVQTPYYDGLVEEYQAILAEDPHNLAVTIALGNAYYNSGRWKDAADSYGRALSIDPRNADVHADRGTAYRNMGMPDRALAEYRTALEYDPGNQNARYNMGIVYAYDKRDYQAAIRVWEDLLRVSPNHPQSDRMKACITTFKKVLKEGT
jgi:tetratricopeptide (TPR) repeat protein